ncbi:MULTISPECIES: AAA family ATPase [Clostridia]|uniref:AAA family ATPase n=1 Tax=Clostridia TaxID=186801 RepID=UPI00336BEF43
MVLDEPEIHLHPQWQIAYAELLVLLQKKFDLSVVVTTHSPYFVDAINLFSCKYNTDNNVNYYISSVNE